MKKLFALALCLLLMLPCLACAQEIIVNKAKDAQTDFAFADDAALLEVYFPQIFGCDAALVRFGEYTMLIDCAGTQWEEVHNLLKRLKISELTYAVNSHPDADHIGGFNSIAKRVPIGEFLLGFPEDYDSGDEVRFRVYSDLHKYNVPFRQVSSGDTIEFGDVSITVLQRTDEHLPRVNNKSVMLMIRYGERSIFFTGDIQGLTQQLLADDESIDIDTDILKFPHHGYQPMNEDFIARTSPEFVIATTGKQSDAGIVQLKELGIPFLMPANRALKLTTDGTTWLIERL